MDNVLEAEYEKNTGNQITKQIIKWMKQILPYTLIQIESPKIPIFHWKEVVKCQTLVAKNDASSQSPIPKLRQ